MLYRALADALGLAAPPLEVVGGELGLRLLLWLAVGFMNPGTGAAVACRQGMVRTSCRVKTMTDLTPCVFHQHHHEHSQPLTRLEPPHPHLRS